MTRTRTTVSRHDWEALVSNLDGDVQDTLSNELRGWADGNACEAVEYTADSLGRIDSESSPSPGDLANVG